MKLRINPDGTVRALWSDTVDWQSIGPVSVSRASQVEFCDHRQMWYVRAGLARNALHQILQAVLRRPFGEILYWSPTRDEALEWERGYFGPGGLGWPGPFLEGRVRVG